MGHYMIELSYTAESWKTQVATQADVIDRITPLVAQCKGTIECIYYAFGDRDLVGVLTFPTPEDAASFGLAATAGGSMTSYRTTPLLTVAQGKASMKKAASAAKAYQPPVDISLVAQRKPVKSKS
jgi:uncharacterized protein with GYD domain